MSIHVAILRSPYLDLILRGGKTIESRLYINRKAPFGEATAGERIFFKQSAGPYVATATIAEVQDYDALTPARLRELCEQYEPGVMGGKKYWIAKQHARFASFLHLRDVEPLDVGPAMEPSRGPAWFVLSDAQAPLVEIPLTDGAIRNGWVRVGAAYERFPTGPVTLLMPDGEVLATQINERRHIGGRGWPRYHQMYGNRPGDAVRFVVVGEACYRVSFVKQHD